jgi:hypothetical protein
VTAPEATLTIIGESKQRITYARRAIVTVTVVM